MKDHVAEGLNFRESDVVVESTSDRVKKSWVSGLSGNVIVRKTGLF